MKFLNLIFTRHRVLGEPWMWAMHLRGGSRKNNLQKRKKEAEFKIDVEVCQRQQKVMKKKRREERRELARSELRKALTNSSYVSTVRMSA
jgi:hypothetical protein